MLNFLEENNSKRSKGTTTLFLGADTSLRNEQVLNCQAPLHFTEPEDLLPSSQESTNCLSSARWIYTIPYYLFKTYFHIILWTEYYFICSVGQRFALLEEKAVLSTVLRKFKLESLSRKEEMDLMFQLILRPKHGLKIKISPR